MDGQDLLSAALDECGLGDLFSNSLMQDDLTKNSLLGEDCGDENQNFSNTNQIDVSNGNHQLSHSNLVSIVSNHNNNNHHNNNAQPLNTVTIVNEQQPLQIKKVKRIIIRQLPSTTTTSAGLSSNNISPKVILSNGVKNQNGNIVTLTNVNTLNSLSSSSTSSLVTTSGSTFVNLNGSNNSQAKSSVPLKMPIVNFNPISENMQSSNVIFTNNGNLSVKGSSINTTTKCQQANNSNQSIQILNSKLVNINHCYVNGGANGTSVTTQNKNLASQNNSYTNVGNIVNVNTSNKSNNKTAATNNRIITIKTIRPLTSSNVINASGHQQTSVNASTVASTNPRIVISNNVQSFKCKSLISNNANPSSGNNRRISAKYLSNNGNSINNHITINGSGVSIINNKPNGNNHQNNSVNGNGRRIVSQSQKLEEENRHYNSLLNEEVKKLIEDEEEEFANLETFADYMPSKLRIGTRHPDQVVETASLASIPPPDVYYRLAIPEEVIDEGRLSALQLESIIYASQQHENILADGCRAGFLIGDGAGVGKGRTVAGIIYENYLRLRKRSLWFSVSTDLKYDAERDLYDIGANKIEVHLLNKFKYGFKIHSPENDNIKRGIIFSTYNSLIGESTSISGKYSTRFNQILQWCGEDFDGVIIFDECHKAKNLFPNGSGRATKTGQAVLELQKRLPKARVVYASATGATEPRNMGYMTRLGIWGPGTPFDDFNHFVSTVEKRGVGAMELVAIDLKMRGMYMARQLSFKGVHFRIEHVPLSREFIRIYNCCCRLWVSAKTKFEKALDLMGADPQVSKAVWTQFWAAHQRFFKYLCIASKVKFAVAFVKEALRCNKSVVIGLQSTGEARTIEQLEDNGGELNDFVSTAKSVFQSLVEKHFPAPNRKKLAKLLGQKTSFFDQLGITFTRNENDEIVASFNDNEENTSQNSQSQSKKSFFECENEDSDDDFVSVDDEDEANSKSSDSSDFDSDDMSDIDDLMDEKLGLKRKRGGGNNNGSSSLKFMDILLGPPTGSTGNRNVQRSKRKKLKKLAKNKDSVKQRKSMKNKYQKFYDNFDNVGEDVGAYCEGLRDQLLQQLDSFGERLPPNTLDELIDELGGPENVAEMTGRKGRVVSTEDGCVQYEARSENDVSLEMLNLVEKQRFMDDDKRVAIISEAASSGISLHADRRAKNRWRRVHLTVELPWSADRAIQQFGRTHRSNQVSAPEYVFLISHLAGEKRFASIVAKRLESLGALTHGDRRATESRDLSQFNIDTKYGRQALEIVMKMIANQTNSDVKPLVSPPENYSRENFFDDCREGLAGVGMLTIDRKTGYCSLDKDYANINKFLNRILGLEVELQNTLFRYFNDTMDAVIKQAKRNGRYDSGIIDLSSDVGNVQKLNEEKYILKASSGATKIQLHTVSIDRGLSYERAYNMYCQALAEDDYFKEEIGFYVSSSDFQIRKTIFLAIPENPNKNKDVKQIFRIYKPSLGLQSKYETKSSLHERGSKMTDLAEAEKLWREHYEQSDSQCSHMLLFGRCRQNGAHGFSSDMLHKRKCDTGVRKRTYCILSGSVLTVWPEIEKSIPYIQTHKLQIVRLKTEDGLKYIGPMVPPMFVDEVRNCLTKLSSEK